MAVSMFLCCAQYNLDGLMVDVSVQQRSDEAY